MSSNKRITIRNGFLKIGRYPCKVCGEVFNTKQSLGGHSRKHYPLSPNRVPRGFTRPKKKCEVCGRFVSIAQFNKHVCRRPNHVTIQDNWKIDENRYQCPFCSSVFTKMGICSHVWLKHLDGKSHRPLTTKRFCGIPWNKGLTAKNDERLARMAKNVPKQGHALSKTTKNKLSIIMKRRHLEGKAHNIGKSRWANIPSYPEKFFIKVIENEFYNKDYKYEFSVGKYSIDFAWVDIKKAIEIDGEQHDRKEYAERDARKDAFLQTEGWDVLRIKWKEMFKNTQHCIKIAYNFIHFI